MTTCQWSRREFLASTGALCVTTGLAQGDERSMHRRAVPVTGEALPVIGLGTFSVFDVASEPGLIQSRRAIVDALLGEGGSVIDTSPMYRRSEGVIGDIIEAGSPREAMFIATKVWTEGRDSGRRQMQRSAELMNTEIIDLMQVHNLRDTAAHMATIRELIDEGRIRYSGLTHYRADALDELERAMTTHKPDFIQINYSLGEREAAARILPLARDMGIGVVINRPYQGGALFRAVGEAPLPDWAQEFAASWGQFFLKFIIGHSAVTCAIPATSKLSHMRDNLEAGFGSLPDEPTRRRMIDYMEGL